MAPMDIDITDDIAKANKYNNKQYSFDYVFDQYTNQREIFDKTTRRLINDIIDGYNATCFAYGATGAGKTHTYFILNFVE